jgi:hypothetical protein
MKLARTMTYSDFHLFDDRVIPGKMRIVPSDKPEEFTEVTYDEVQFDVKLKENTFTLRNLQR